MENLNIDETWIDDFEQIEKFYNGLYTEQIQRISVCFLYVNKNNELYHIKKKLLELLEPQISKEHLVFLLRRNCIHDNIKFYPASILKYNINLRPKDIIHYLKNVETYDFLDLEKNINTIVWEDSIPLFHDLNSLIIVYAEKIKTNNTTKRVYIKKKGRRNTKRKYT